MAPVNPQELARVLSQQSPSAFENFVADLLVTDHPGAYQTNPGGGGDGGVDVQLDVDGKSRVWQVKAFHGPLNASQMGQVRRSIATVAERCAKEQLVVARYDLVTAWTPNDKALRTFHANVGPLNCPATWNGEALIRGLVAKHPQIYDALINGERHLERFVQERALLAGVGPLDAKLPDFRDAIVHRQRALKDLEGLQTGPYRVATTHLTMASGGSLPDVVRNLEGVMHQVEYLDDGSVEVQSAIPREPHSSAEPIKVHTSLSKLQLETDASARDWMYWGKPPTDLDMNFRVEGGPFHQDNLQPARATFFAAESGNPQVPPILMESQTEDGAGHRSLRIVVSELTSGLVGGGRRIVGVSEGGAVRFEFRMGSSEVPEELKWELGIDGGQVPSKYLEDLEALVAIGQGDTFRFSVRGQVIATGRDFSPPAVTSDFIEVARTFSEWAELADEVLVMPTLADMTRADLRELEDVRLALRREFEPRPWTELTLTVGDPQAALQAFANLPAEGTLVRTQPAVFEFGGVRVTMPRVWVEAYSGVVVPPSLLSSDLKTGALVTLKGGPDALVSWGVLVDDNQQPVVDWTP